MWAKKQTKFLEDKFGEAKLIIGAANVICGEAQFKELGLELYLIQWN